MNKCSNFFPAVGSALMVLAGLAGAPAFAQNCEVKVGAAGPMSGGAAAYGLAVKAAAEFQAALVNEAGGLQVGGQKCMVKVLSFDSLYTAAGGAAAGNYFASQGIHAVLGPVGAPEISGFRDVAKRNGEVSFNMTYNVEAIGPNYPLTFHMLQAPPVWGPIMIKSALDRYKFKTAVLVGANDQGGTDGTKALAKMYRDLGVTSDEEYYQRGTMDFSPIATRIMNLHPDVVEIATMPPVDQSILIKRLVEAGFQGTIGSLGGAGEKPLNDGFGGAENIKNAFWLLLFPTENPTVPKLQADYARLMTIPLPTTPHFYVAQTSMELILKAISIAGTDKDGEKIAQALRTMPLESRYFGKLGWRGKAQYGINQELTFPPGLGGYQNGKRLPVEAVEIPTE